jgi:hypothetical protein
VGHIDPRQLPLRAERYCEEKRPRPAGRALAASSLASACEIGTTGRRCNHSGLLGWCVEASMLHELDGDDLRALNGSFAKRKQRFALGVAHELRQGLL